MNRMITVMARNKKHRTVTKIKNHQAKMRDLVSSDIDKI